MIYKNGLFFLISNQFFLIWSQVRLFWQTAHVDKRSKTVIFREFWTKIAKNYQEQSRIIKRFQMEKLKILNLKPLTDFWIYRSVILSVTVGQKSVFRTKCRFHSRIYYKPPISKNILWVLVRIGIEWTPIISYNMIRKECILEEKLRRWIHNCIRLVKIVDIPTVLLIKTIRHLLHSKAKGNLSMINWNYWAIFHIRFHEIHTFIRMELFNNVFMTKIVLKNFFHKFSKISKA